MKHEASNVKLSLAGFETVMEGADMKASVLTVAAGQQVPWHYHSQIVDHFFCLDGPMIVETQAPQAIHELSCGEDCAIPPKTPHLVYGKNNGPCRYLLLQGTGTYDYVPARDQNRS